MESWIFFLGIDYYNVYMIFQNLSPEIIIENVILFIGVVVGLIIAFRVYKNNPTNFLNRFLALTYLSVIAGLFMVILTSDLFEGISPKGIQVILLLSMLFFMISAIFMIMCRNVLKKGESNSIKWNVFSPYLIAPIIVFLINLYFVISSDFRPLESIPEYFTSILILPMLSFYGMMLTYAIIGSLSFYSIMKVNMGSKRRNGVFFFWGTLIAYVLCAPFFFIPTISNTIGYLIILIGNLLISLGLFMKTDE